MNLQNVGEGWIARFTGFLKVLPVFVVQIKHVAVFHGECLLQGAPKPHSCTANMLKHVWTHPATVPALSDPIKEMYVVRLQNGLLPFFLERSCDCFYTFSPENARLYFLCIAFLLK